MQFSKVLLCAASLALGASLPQAHAAPAKPASLIANQYIVVLKTPLSGDPSGQVQSLLARVGGGRVLHQYQYALSGFAARISAAQADALARLPQVKYVVQDQVMKANATQANPPSWGLDRVDQTSLPLNQQFSYPTQGGAGVHVYVVDTGLNAAHTQFTGRVGAGRNFAPDHDGTLGTILNSTGLNSLNPLNTYALDFGTGLFKGPTTPGNTSDCNGHGSHVSGTVLGTSFGIAKLATVHPVRVLGCGGGGDTSGVVAGVDWIAGNRVLPAVANMSLGGGNNVALDDAVDGAIASGVTFVVAAGNESADACTGSPNRVPNAITVGASTITDSRDTGYSNFGPCVDLFAPGTGITSAWIGGNAATNTIDGTSMASPHVAGAAALYLGSHPSATPDDVTDALLGAATLGALSGVGAGSPNALLYVAP